MSNIIQIKNLTKTYKLKKLEVPVLHNINLEIQAGEMVAIVGPSGSGKSTLMNILGLLDRPTSGEYFLSGEPLTLSMSDRKLAKIRASKIGFIFQSFNLLPKLSSLDNVLIPTSYFHQNKSTKSSALNLLKKVGLDHRIGHKPTEMSGGEKQRIAIARALINNPDVILADEPTGNLDSKSGRQILEILKQLNSEGKTILIITHDEKIAAGCHRVIRLFDGSISERVTDDK